MCLLKKEKIHIFQKKRINFFSNSTFLNRPSFAILGQMKPICFEKHKKIKFFFCKPYKNASIFIAECKYEGKKKNLNKFASLNKKTTQKTQKFDFLNFSFDKGRLKKIVSWFFENHGQYKTLQLLEKLKNFGFGYATLGGLSLGIDDLKIPDKKINLMATSETKVAKDFKSFRNAKITGVERMQRLIYTWNQTNDDLKQEVRKYFETKDLFNPIYMMAFSGARGNMSQVRQLVGMRGLMSDPQGQIIDFPIQSNFREGLTLTEYLISTYGARKGIVDTALRTATAGYLTRRLVDVAQHVIVSRFDCGTIRGIFVFDMKEANKTIYSFQNRLVGRVLAQDLFVTNEASDKQKNKKTAELECLQAQLLAPLSSEASTQPLSCGAVASPSEAGAHASSSANASNRSRASERSLATYDAQRNTKLVKIASKNQEIDSKLALCISKVTKKAFVRSPLTCEIPRLLCQLCYGWSLSQGKFVSIGEAVGVIAAQSIGEPGTQLTMRTFHTGGVFAGGLTDQIFAPFDGILQYVQNIPGICIRTSLNEIAFFTKMPGSFFVQKNCLTFFSGSIPYKHFKKNQFAPNKNADKNASILMRIFIPDKCLKPKKQVKRLDAELHSSASLLVCAPASLACVPHRSKATAELRNASKQRSNNRLRLLRLAAQQTQAKHSKLALLRSKGKWQTRERNKESIKKELYKIPAYAVLFIRNNEFVKKKQVLAQFSTASQKQFQYGSAEQTLFSNLAGEFFLRNSNIPFYKKEKFQKINLFIEKRKNFNNEYSQLELKSDILWKTKNWANIWILSAKFLYNILDLNIIFQKGDSVEQTSIFHRTLWKKPKNIQFFIGNRTLRTNMFYLLAIENRKNCSLRFFVRLFDASLKKNADKNADKNASIFMRFVRTAAERAKFRKESALSLLAFASLAGSAEQSQRSKLASLRLLCKTSKGLRQAFAHLLRLAAKQTNARTQRNKQANVALNLHQSNAFGMKNYAQDFVEKKIFSLFYNKKFRYAPVESSKAHKNADKNASIFMRIFIAERARFAAERSKQQKQENEAKLRLRFSAKLCVPAELASLLSLGACFAAERNARVQSPLRCDCRRLHREAGEASLAAKQPLSCGTQASSEASTQPLSVASREASTQTQAAKAASEATAELRRGCFAQRACKQRSKRCEKSAKQTRNKPVQNFFRKIKIDFQKKSNAPKNHYNQVSIFEWNSKNQFLFYNQLFFNKSIYCFNVEKIRYCKFSYIFSFHSNSKTPCPSLYYFRIFSKLNELIFADVQDINMYYELKSMKNKPIIRISFPKYLETLTNGVFFFYYFLLKINLMDYRSLHSFLTKNNKKNLKFVFMRDVNFQENSIFFGSRKKSAFGYSNYSVIFFKENKKKNLRNNIKMLAFFSAFLWKIKRKNFLNFFQKKFGNFIIYLSLTNLKNKRLCQKNTLNRRKINFWLCFAKKNSRIEPDQGTKFKKKEFSFLIKKDTETFKIFLRKNKNSDKNSDKNADKNASIFMYINQKKFGVFYKKISKVYGFQNYLSSELYINEIVWIPQENYTLSNFINKKQIKMHAFLCKNLLKTVQKNLPLFYFSNRQGKKIPFFSTLDGICFPYSAKRKHLCVPSFASVVSLGACFARSAAVRLLRSHARLALLCTQPLSCGTHASSGAREQSPLSCGAVASLARVLSFASHSTAELRCGTRACKQRSKHSTAELRNACKQRSAQAKDRGKGSHQTNSQMQRWVHWNKEWLQQKISFFDIKMRIKMQPFLSAFLFKHNNKKQQTLNLLFQKKNVNFVPFQNKKKEFSFFFQKMQKNKQKKQICVQKLFHIRSKAQKNAMKQPINTTYQRIGFDSNKSICSSSPISKAVSNQCFTYLPFFRAEQQTRGTKNLKTLLHNFNNFNISKKKINSSHFNGVEYIENKIQQKESQLICVQNYLEIKKIYLKVQSGWFFVIPNVKFSFFSNSHQTLINPGEFLSKNLCFEQNRLFQETVFYLHKNAHKNIYIHKNACIFRFMYKTERAQQKTAQQKQQKKVHQFFCFSLKNKKVQTSRFFNQGVLYAMNSFRLSFLLEQKKRNICSIKNETNKIFASFLQPFQYKIFENPKNFLKNQDSFYTNFFEKFSSRKFYKFYHSNMLNAQKSNFFQNFKNISANLSIYSAFQQVNFLSNVRSLLCLSFASGAFATLSSKTTAERSKQRSKHPSKVTTALPRFFSSLATRSKLASLLCGANSSKGPRFPLSKATVALPRFRGTQLASLSKGTQLASQRRGSFAERSRHASKGPRQTNETISTKERSLLRGKQSRAKAKTFARSAKHNIISMFKNFSKKNQITAKKTFFSCVDRFSKNAKNAKKFNSFKKFQSLIVRHKSKNFLANAYVSKNSCVQFIQSSKISNSSLKSLYLFSGKTNNKKIPTVFVNPIQSTVNFSLCEKKATFLNQRFFSFDLMSQKNRLFFNNIFFWLKKEKTNFVFFKEMEKKFEPKSNIEKNQRTQKKIPNIFENFIFQKNPSYFGNTKFFSPFDGELIPIYMNEMNWWKKASEISTLQKLDMLFSGITKKDLFSIHFNLSAYFLLTFPVFKKKFQKPINFLFYFLEFLKTNKNSYLFFQTYFKQFQKKFIFSFYNNEKNFIPKIFSLSKKIYFCYFAKQNKASRLLEFVASLLATPSGCFAAKRSKREHASGLCIAERAKQTPKLNSEASLAAKQASDAKKTDFSLLNIALYSSNNLEKNTKQKNLSDLFITVFFDAILCNAAKLALLQFNRSHQENGAKHSEQQKFFYFTNFFNKKQTQEHKSAEFLKKNSNANSTFVTKYQNKLYMLKNMKIGYPELSKKPYIGKFVVYGDCIFNKALKKPGQIVHISSQKITLRNGQPFFISPKGIFHLSNIPYIEKNIQILTLPYQTLQSGDIVQGIPKVEQFFEARTTVNGRLFMSSLPILLKGIFQRYKSKLPLEQAVRQSFLKIQQLIVDGVQRVYRSQGVSIVDKHLEVVVRQMTTKVQIINGAQTGFFPGELVSLELIERINKFLIVKIRYEPVILGITRASLEVESFLSASSFQQTTKILSLASISRKKDFLKGLKENLLVGNLIPSGTGYMMLYKNF